MELAPSASSHTADQNHHRRNTIIWQCPGAIPGGDPPLVVSGGRGRGKRSPLFDIDNLHNGSTISHVPIAARMSGGRGRGGGRTLFN